MHPEQVFAIIREELRRIFIWKGPKSPTHKIFLSFIHNRFKEVSKSQSTGESLLLIILHDILDVIEYSLKELIIKKKIGTN
ncbi:MAG: hypothetical protein ACFE9V_00400 [Candidatus Hodarchaeota archaeon]